MMSEPVCFWGPSRGPRAGGTRPVGNAARILIEPNYEALGDTWAFDYNSNTWTELPTQVAPEARGKACHGLQPG